MDKQIRLGKFLILILAILLGTFLRFKDLAINPPELFSDEITNVLSARNILLTGRDIDGRAYPLYFHNRVESRAPIYGYLSAFSTFIFGVNSFGVRFPAALLGVISIVLVYWLSMLMTKNMSVSVVASVAYSLLPWSVHYSRIGWEAAPILPLFLFSLALFIFSLEKRRVWILTSYFAFGLLIYTHRSTEFLSPLFLVLMIFIFWKRIKRNLKVHIIGFLVYSLLLLPLLFSHFSDPLLHLRSERIFTFSEGVNGQTVSIFVKNYLSHFSYNFLFSEGDSNLRHGTHRTGVLSIWMLPLLLLGLYEIFKSPKTPASKLLILWLIVFPLGGSLTNDGVPHATRTLIGAPLFCLICGFGFKKSLSRLFLALILSLTIFGLFKFYNIYFNIYPKESASWWEYGNQQIFDYIKENSKNYERFCLGNINYWNKEPLINFYLKGLPLKIIEGTQDPKCSLKSTLLVLPTGVESPREAGLLKEIKTPGGQAVWGIHQR